LCWMATVVVCFFFCARRGGAGGWGWGVGWGGGGGGGGGGGVAGAVKSAAAAEKLANESPIEYRKMVSPSPAVCALFGFPRPAHAHTQVDAHAQAGTTLEP